MKLTQRLSEMIIREVRSPMMMNDDTVILGNNVYLINGFFTSISMQSPEGNITTDMTSIGDGNFYGLNAKTIFDRPFYFRLALTLAF
jgi:hypothetical protein